MPYATSTDLAALVQGDVPAATADLLLEIATVAVDGEVGASLEETIYVETFDDGAPERNGDTIWLVPANWPVEVAEVVEDGTALTDGDDYAVTVDGRLVRDGSSWDGEVEVTYTTGFASGDAAYETARRITLQMVTRAAANPEHLDSLTADGVTPSFVVREGTTAVPPTTLFELEKEDLEPWRWRRRLA